MPPHRFIAEAPEDRVIGFVGRLVPGKGGAVLLYAAKQVVDQFPRETLSLWAKGLAAVSGANSRNGSELRSG